MKLIDIKNLTFEYFRRDDEGNIEEMVEALAAQAQTDALKAEIQ